MGQRLEKLKIHTETQYDSLRASYKKLFIRELVDLLLFHWSDNWSAVSDW